MPFSLGRKRLGLAVRELFAELLCRLIHTSVSFHMTSINRKQLRVFVCAAWNLRLQTSDLVTWSEFNDHRGRTPFNCEQNPSVTPYVYARFFGSSGKPGSPRLGSSPIFCKISKLLGLLKYILTGIGIMPSSVRWEWRCHGIYESLISYRKGTDPI